jgi:hypothetical protein
MPTGFKPINIQGYEINRENLNALYDKNQRIYQASFDLLGADYLTLCDTTRPPDLNPTDDFYQFTEWDIFAGVQRRTYPEEEFKYTAGVLQNYVRTMMVQEIYSLGKVSNEVVMAMQAGNFGPLENFMSEFATKAGQEHAQEKTQDFWNIFNYGTLTAGSSHFDQSLASGQVTDASGNYIYDSKPLFAKSGGSEHPQSNLVTGTTFYNLSISLPWSRANFETVRFHIQNTNNRDVFGRRFRNKPTHIFANEAMEETIESDMRSAVKDMDVQVNIRQGEMNRVYTPWLTDTDAWGMLDPIAMVKWVENWRPQEQDVWRENRTNVHWIRISTFHGWCIKDWHSGYWCNQAES